MWMAVDKPSGTGREDPPDPFKDSKRLAPISLEPRSERDMSDWLSWIPDLLVREMQNVLDHSSLEEARQLRAIATQRGSAFRACGVVLPTLTEEVFRSDPEYRRRDVKASFCIGYSADKSELGPYVGVRLAGRNSYTANQTVHDSIFEELLPPLQETFSDALVWQQRRPREVWSIWAWALRGTQEPTGKSKRLLVEQWARGLSGVWGLAW
jgi:hypothetical protein